MMIYTINSTLIIRCGLLRTVVTFCIFYIVLACNETDIYRSLNDINCRFCEAGFYLVSDCNIHMEISVCERCPEGYFQPVCNKDKQCIRCRGHCPDRMQKIVNMCSSTMDLNCQCTKGRYWIKLTHTDGVCLPHGRCPIGQGILTKGTSTKNSRCASCSIGKTFSDQNSFQTCQNCTECNVFKTECTRAKDATCVMSVGDASTTAGLSEGIIAVIVCACIALPTAVVAILCACWYCKRRNRLTHIADALYEGEHENNIDINLGMNNGVANGIQLDNNIRNEHFPLEPIVENEGEHENNIDINLGMNNGVANGIQLDNNIRNEHFPLEPIVENEDEHENNIDINLGMNNGVANGIQLDNNIRNKHFPLEPIVENETIAAAVAIDPRVLEFVDERQTVPRDSQTDDKTIKSKDSVKWDLGAIHSQETDTETKKLERQNSETEYVGERNIDNKKKYKWDLGHIHSQETKPEFVRRNNDSETVFNSESNLENLHDCNTKDLAKDKSDDSLMCSSCQGRILAQGTGFSKHINPRSLDNVDVRGELSGVNLDEDSEQRIGEMNRLKDDQKMSVTQYDSNGSINTYI